MIIDLISFRYFFGKNYFFCGIINGVRRPREGTEGGGGGLWPVFFLGGEGGLGNFRK